MWDTAGQEKFKAITQSFYKGADAIIFVFDLSNKSSFLQLNEWIESVYQKIGDNIKKIIVANKKDLKWAVDEQQIQEKLSHYGMNIYYTSAKTGENINEVFYDIMNQLYKDMNLMSMKIYNSSLFADNGEVDVVQPEDINNLNADNGQRLVHPSKSEINK